MTEWIISSSVLIVGMLLLRWLLEGKISLRLQYALWLVVLLRLLCPLNFGSSPISVQNYLVEEPSAVGTVLPPAQSGGAEAMTQTPPQQSDSNIPNTPAITPPVSQPQAPVQEATVDIAKLAETVWIIGAVAMGAFVLGSNMIFVWLLKRTRLDVDMPKCGVPVYTSPAVRTPCLVGLFRPVIYVTGEVAEEPDTWKYVVTHELTHLHHGDHLMGLLRCTALVLHWYNPLVWLAVKMIRADGELACDEGTVARLGEQERLDYGRTLIRLTCKSRGPTELVITATTMSDSPDSIRNRIMLIAKQPRTLAVSLIGCILCLCVMVGCTFTSAVEPDTPEDTLPPETTAPVETTQPPEMTEPTEFAEPVVRIPKNFVSLNDVLNHSDIRLYCDDTTILMSEDGMNVELSTDSKLGYRNSYVCVAMKAAPIIVDDTVYIHEDFYYDFLIGADGISVSLFNGVKFFPDEVLDALRQPDGSEFHAKVREQVCLPGSMGIEVPRIDPGRVFQKTSLDHLPTQLMNELLGYGYRGTFTYGEYEIIVNSVTLKQAGISNDDETTVGEYREKQQSNQNQLTPEQLAFFEEKQILVEDYWYLYKWFYGDFMSQEDEALKAVLETCYIDNLALSLGWEYPES